MKTESQISSDQTLSTMVAGEDLHLGDFVATFTQTYELPTYLWDNADFALSPHELVRLKLIPHDAGTPMKIIGLSLPFVYVLEPNHAVRTLDVRRIQLVRLAPRCAKAVWKRMRRRSSDRRKRD